MIWKLLALTFAATQIIVTPTDLQFWNCAEVEIKVVNGCGASSSPPAALPSPKPTISLPTVTSTTTSTVASTTGSTMTTTSSTSTTTKTPSNCASYTGVCGRDKLCANGMCCSQWGYCGTGDAYCGSCCQSGNCLINPTSRSPTPNPTYYLLPTTSTSSTSSTSSTTTSTTSSSFIGQLVLNSSARCGTSELDAREHCKHVCSTNVDCAAGEFCWVVHDNYCGSLPQRVYENPVQSSVNSRCGVSEVMARTFCGEPCSWQCSKPGESCFAVSNAIANKYQTFVATTCKI